MNAPGHGHVWREGSLMDQLPTDLRERLLELGRPTRFPVNEILSAQGDSSAGDQKVFVLTEGVVKATRISQPDGTPMLVTLLYPGDAPGMVAALLGKSGHLTYTAAKPTSAMVIGHEVFAAFVRDHHQVTNATCTVLGHEIRARDMSLAFATENVRARLVGFLGRQQVIGGVCNGDGTMRIDLGLSHADLAAAIGAATLTVGQILRQLESEGVISGGYKTIYIKKQLGPHTRPPQECPSRPASAAGTCTRCRKVVGGHGGRPSPPPVTAHIPPQIRLGRM